MRDGLRNYVLSVLEKYLAEHDINLLAETKEILAEMISIQAELAVHNSVRRALDEMDLEGQPDAVNS